MSPSKNAYFDGMQEAKKMGRSAQAIQAMHTQGLAQEICDNINLAPEDYIPRHYEGGVPEALAKDVAELMLEDATARRDALVELRSAIMAIPGLKYRGIVADLSDRIQAVDRVLGTVSVRGGGAGGGTCQTRVV